MHRMIPFFALTFLTGCGMSEEKFMEEFEAKFCEKLEECGDFSCDDATGTTATGTEMTCENYDKAAAKDCINGEWTCDADFGFPIPPTVCNDVCGASTGSGSESSSSSSSSSSS